MKTKMTIGLIIDFPKVNIMPGEKINVSKQRSSSQFTKRI
jgi:hypothetical protein